MLEPLGDPVNPSLVSNVTRILSADRTRRPPAAEQLLPLVYDELRKLAAAKLAQEKPGQTLQATALVHEAYLRLVDVEKAQHWNSRGHFFAAAAEAMRRILVENARRKRQEKHGGQIQRVALEELRVGLESPPDELLRLDETLAELGKSDVQCRRTGQTSLFRWTIDRAGGRHTRHLASNRLSRLGLRTSVALRASNARTAISGQDTVQLGFRPR